MSDCTTFRRCSKCHTEYPATTEYFSPHRKMKSGLQAYCKKCAAEWQREYRRTHADVVHETDKRRSGTPKRRADQRKQYWKDVEHSRAMKRESSKRHPETLKKWKRENRQRWIDDTHKWRAKHLERLRELQYKWRREHPERWKAISKAGFAARRAREKNATGKFTSSDIQAQLRGQGNRCWWCGCKLENGYHIDHRIPLSRGGSNAPENIVLACSECNQRKHNKLPSEWNGRLF